MSAPAAPDRRSDGGIAWLVALGTLAVCAAVNLPMLATCAARGDTWALMLHSTRFHPASPGEWMRSGFERYFVNYPEATRPYTGFVRPVVNASVWLESLLAAGPNSAVFYLTNYLGHAACAALAYLVGIRVGGLSRPRALLAAALFACTASAVELLQSPAFRADMLGAAFGTAALLAAVQWLRGGRGSRVEIAALLLVLAVLSKETAITAPLLVAGALLALEGERSRRARLGAAATVLVPPLAIFALARALGPRGGTYVSLVGAGRSAAEVLSSAFFPGGGALDVWAVLRGAAAPWDAAQVLAAFALNVLAAVLVVRLLARRDGPALRLAAMAVLALAVPMLLAPAPRMMYFGQVFALPLLARALPARRGAARSLAALALVLGALPTLMRMAAMQPALMRANRDSHRVQAALRGELRDPAVRRVYLLNDVSGDYGALAMLRSVALDAGRRDVYLRVVSSMGRFDRPGAPGTIGVASGDGALSITESCGARCDFSFPGVLPQDRRQLGDATIAYRRVQPRALEVRIDARTADWALVGFDPSTPGVHVADARDARWRPFRGAGR